MKAQLMGIVQISVTVDEIVWAKWVMGKIFGMDDDIETLSALLALFTGVHQSPFVYQHKGPVMQSFDCFFIVNLDKPLRKQWSRG